MDFTEKQPMHQLKVSNIVLNTTSYVEDKQMNVMNLANYTTDKHDNYCSLNIDE